MGMRGDHLAGREAPLIDQERITGGPSHYFVGYVEGGQVGALVGIYQDPASLYGHFTTSFELVGLYSCSWWKADPWLESVSRLVAFLRPVGRSVVPPADLTSPLRVVLVVSGEVEDAFYGAEIATEC
jgi:hypothetical protein